MATNTRTPYRQIRALYDDETITVYQAYSRSIADAAVAAQRLQASPSFSTTRMTWIKPSWAWMLYRAGYSYKDARQERILALKLTHEKFRQILARGILSTHRADPEPEPEAQSEGQSNDNEDESNSKMDRRRGERQKNKKPGVDVRIQWDPERTVRLGKLEHRSIQIGISGAVGAEWALCDLVGIEDVTDKARELKRVLDERPDVTDEELVRLGLVPVERPYEIPEELQRTLGMIWEDEPVETTYLGS